MLIECTIKRVNGTKITMGTNNYHFKPTDPADEDSPHVCEVEDSAHAKRLLSIKEAYRAAGKVDASVAKQLKEDEEEKAAAEAARKAAEDALNANVIPVSEETQIELVQLIIKLMESFGKEKKIEVKSADDLQVKDVSALLNDFAEINVKNKNEIAQYGKGCDVELDKNESAGRMIKDLFNALLDRYTVEDEEENSELGSDADTEEHAEGLTANDEESDETDSEGAEEEEAQ